MSLLNEVRVEARIVLAASRLRLRELLRLERGSVVALDGDVDTASVLQVNGVAVAVGRIRVEGERTRFEVVEARSDG